MEDTLLLINSIEEIMKTKFYNFNKEFNEKDKFRAKIMYLEKNIELGIPILIEGPKCLSKKLSSEIVCKYLEREISSINLSSDNVKINSKYK